MLNPSNFTSNPVAGAQIASSGAAFAPNAVATGTGTVGGLSSSAALINGDVYTVSLGTNTTSFIAGASAALRTLGGNDALIALQGIEEPAGRRRRAVKHATARSMARRAQCGSLSSSQSRHGLTRNYLNSLDKFGRPGTARGPGSAAL